MPTFSPLDLFFISFFAFDIALVLTRAHYMPIQTGSGDEDLRSINSLKYQQGRCNTGAKVDLSLPRQRHRETWKTYKLRGETET